VGEVLTPPGAGRGEGLMDWQKLAEQLGPQSAPYMFSEDWDGKLRTIACKCGALLEILDGEPAAPGDYLCDACTLRLAFTGSDEPIGIGKYIKGGQ
jgi:hypothetical protein